MANFSNNNSALLNFSPAYYGLSNSSKIIELNKEAAEISKRQKFLTDFINKSNPWTGGGCDALREYSTLNTRWMVLLKEKRRLLSIIYSSSSSAL